MLTLVDDPWEHPEELFATPEDPDRGPGLRALSETLKGANDRKWDITLDLLGDLIRTERAREERPLEPSTALLADLFADIQSRYDQRVATGQDVMGHRTGFTRLDDLLGGLDRGRLSVMLAAPGAGKTTFSNQMTYEIARTGAPVIYVSFENSRQDLLIKQIARLAGKSSRDIQRGRVAPSGLREAYETYRNQGGERIFYVEGGAATTVESIRVAVAQAQKQFPGTYPIVILDFLQRLATTSDITSKGGGLDDMRGRVGLISQQLRSLANDEQCHIWAISSTNREAYKNNDKSNLGMASGRESGDIEFAADHVITLAADKEEGLSMTSDPFVLKVVKNRHGEGGTVNLTRDRVTMRIAETEGRLNTFASPITGTIVDAAKAGWKSSPVAD